MHYREDGLPRGPLTYICAGEEGATVDEAWAEALRDAAPDFLHHAHDVPLNSIWGTTQGYSGWLPDHEAGPGEVRRKVEDLRNGTNRLHDAGVGKVFPYMNPSIIGGSVDECITHNFFSYGGDAAAAQGFFHFWRRLDEFADLGCDRLTKDDPFDWMQRDVMSFAPYSTDTPYSRYEPCLRREGRLGFVEICAGLIAEAGYDAVFSDDNLVQCYCPQCQRGFRAFLRKHYGHRLAELEECLPIEQTMLYSDDGQGTGPAMRRATSGRLSAGPPLDTEAFPVDPWATLLWEASQAFWAQTNGDMLLRVREAGRRHNPNFFVVANWGMSMTARQFATRRQLGHHFIRWQPGAVWQMLEEGGSHGYIAPGLVEEFWPLLRACAAHGVEPALLAYTRDDPSQRLLGFAEVASANTGAWCAGRRDADTVNLYRTFFDERWELFDQAEPLCEVGVLYSLDDILRNNDEHLRLVYAVCRALGRSHIPYDIVTPSQLSRRRFSVVINPGARAIPPGALDGSAVLAIGPGGLPPVEFVDYYEVQLDNLLDLSREKQEEALAACSHVDLTEPAPLAHHIVEMAGHDLALSDSRAIHAARLRPFIIRKDKRVVVHVVNYGCTSMSSTPPPGPAPAFSLRAPDIEGWRVEGAWTEGPGAARESLTLTGRELEQSVSVPSTEVYRVVVLQYR